MAASNWIVYSSFKEFLGDGTIDLDGDTFIMGLAASGYTPALTHSGIADITNELSGSGYARKTLTPTWTLTTDTATFDCDDQVWTASGGPITARYAFIFDDTVTTPVADPLVCYSLLDTTPADVTATDGNTLTISINASGVFTLSGATS